MATSPTWPGVGNFPKSRLAGAIGEMPGAYGPILSAKAEFGPSQTHKGTASAEHAKQTRQAQVMVDSLMSMAASFDQGPGIYQGANDSWCGAGHGLEFPTARQPAH